MLRVIEDTANRGAFTLVVPPVQFSVKGVYGNTVIDIAQFNAYVERILFAHWRLGILPAAG